MSPRSAEFLAEAHRRLVPARRELDADDPSSAASLATTPSSTRHRAALSEEGRHARTHRGTWDLFWQTLAATGRFDRSLAGRTREVQELRELADYDAKPPTFRQAEDALDVATRFVAAVD